MHWWYLMISGYQTKWKREWGRGRVRECTLGDFIQFISNEILTLSGASKGFMKTCKIFIKPFKALHRSVKIKIWINFLFLSKARKGGVKAPLAKREKIKVLRNNTTDVLYFAIWWFQLVRSSKLYISKFVMFCTIWFHLYNLKNGKNIHGGLLFLVKLQALA